MDPVSIPSIPAASFPLPPRLEGLRRLAYNLHWAWSPKTRNLWSLIDRTAWNRYRNPVPVISGPTEWSRLLDDEKFLAEYQDVLADFDRYMADGTGHWFQQKHGDKLSGPIAYFCAEYGIHESLGIYSGGLGVLAGDHMKSASDMALPFVGVGLLYRKGYFRQSIDADGHQEHNYPDYDLSRLPLARVQDANGLPLTVNVELPGRDLSVAVWLAQVGRVPVLLLDTDVADNAVEDRPITHILYVRGREMRLHQEIVLGIGGVRAIRALGLAPDVWHLNEGHSALLLAERAREFVAEGQPLDAAWARVKRDSVFTIHTPVSAGNERFESDLVRRVAGPLLDAGKVPVERVLELGLGTDGDRGQFDMTAFSLRLTNGANAVSKLHAHTANSTWQGVVEHEILAVTNGVHGPTWVGSPVVELLVASPGRRPRHARCRRAPGPVLGATRPDPDRRAVGGAPPPEARAGDLRPRPAAEPVLPARRVAVGPRRGRVDPRSEDPDDRLRPALRDLQAGRPAVQRHGPPRAPAVGRRATRPGHLRGQGPSRRTDPGQKVIQEIFQYSARRSCAAASSSSRTTTCASGGSSCRASTRGSTTRAGRSRRPGRRGMKAAQNGVPNISVLDGWWDEGYQGDNGWAIGGREPMPTRPPRTGPTQRTSTGCSRRSSSLPTTTGTRPASRSAGSRRCAVPWPPRCGSSRRPACSRSTPKGCTCRRPGSRSRSRCKSRS